MKRFGTSCGCMIGCWALLLTGASAQERGPQPKELLPPPAAPREDLPPPAVLPVPPPLSVPGAGSPDCSSGAPCVQRTISVPRLTLLEEQKAITVPKLNVQEVAVGQVGGLAVEYREERQTVLTWTLQPREVVQLVPHTTLQPVTVTDPCTGQCRTEYKPCPTVREMKTTVFDKVPVPRTIIVRVPCLKPAPPLQVSKLVVETTTEPAIASRFQLLTIPNEVSVPACPAACPVPHP